MTGRGAPASPPSKTCTYLAAWLTGRVLAELRLNDRQRLAITHLKIHGRITNSDFQKLTGAPHRTAARDLMGLVRLGLLDHKGTGRGAGYVLHLNRAINVPNAPPTQTRREPGNPVTVKGSAKGSPSAQRALTKSARNRPNRPSVATGQTGLALLGLEQPFVRALLEKMQSLPASDRALTAANGQSHNGCLTFWAVTVQGKSGHLKQSIVKLAIGNNGTRNAALESLPLDQLHALPPNHSPSFDQHALHSLLTDQAAQALHRDLEHRAELTEGTWYSSRLLALLVL